LDEDRSYRGARPNPFPQAQHHGPDNLARPAEDEDAAESDGCRRKETRKANFGDRIKKSLPAQTSCQQSEVDQEPGDNQRQQACIAEMSLYLMPFETPCKPVAQTNADQEN